MTVLPTMAVQEGEHRVNGPITDADCREYADTLLRHFAPKLTEWEDGFVRSIQARLVAGRVLTDKQRETLDGLMERVARGHGRA